MAVMTAGIEVVFQNLGTDLVERGLHRLDLADHVNAIGVFLDHADDAAQMAFDGFQTSERVGVVFHSFSLPPPGGMGGRMIDEMWIPVKAIRKIGSTESKVSRLLTDSKVRRLWSPKISLRIVTCRVE